MQQFTGPAQLYIHAISIHYETHTKENFLMHCQDHGNSTSELASCDVTSGDVWGHIPHEESTPTVKKRNGFKQGAQN
jgi:hypothetical protein